jgi:hypothetical protein
VRLKPNAVVVTGIIVTVVAVAGHTAMWFSYQYKWNWPWEPITGIALTVTAVGSFTGFYLAWRRARVAIASSFILTYLVMFTYALTLRTLAGEISKGPIARLSDDFLSHVTTVVIFYLGSEAVIGAGKAVSSRGASVEEANQVRQSDRDLVTPLPPA